MREVLAETRKILQKLRPEVRRKIPEGWVWMMPYISPTL